MNDKTRPMGDGSDFNAESGEPRQTLFGAVCRPLDLRSPGSSKNYEGSVRRRHQMEVAAQQREQESQRLMRESDS